MSINDPLELVYRKARARWGIIRGRETFYDENRDMLEWDTKEEAIDWAEENYGEIPLTQEQVVQSALFATKLPNLSARGSDGVMPHNRRSKERDKQRALWDAYDKGS